MFIKITIVFIVCFTKCALSQTEKSILLRLDPKEIVETFKNVISSTYIREMANQMANKAAQQFIQKMKKRKVKYINSKKAAINTPLGRQGEHTREMIMNNEKRHFDNELKYDPPANVVTREIRQKPREGMPLGNEDRHIQQQQVRLLPLHDIKVPPQDEGKYSNEIQPPRESRLPNEERHINPGVRKIKEGYRPHQRKILSKTPDTIQDSHRIKQGSAENDVTETNISPLHDNDNGLPVVKDEFKPVHKQFQVQDSKQPGPYRETEKVGVTNAPNQFSLPKPPFQKKRRRPNQTPKTDKTLLDENVAFALLKEPSPDGDDWELDSLEMSEIRNDIPVVEVKKINGVYFRRFLGSLPVE